MFHTDKPGKMIIVFQTDKSGNNSSVSNGYVREGDSSVSKG